MKKLTVVLMSVLLASFAFAQFDLGVKLGANYSYIDTEEFEAQLYIDQFSDLQNITGFVGGAFAIIGFGNFGIQLEGLFSMEGFSIEEIVEGNIENTTIRTNYVNAVAMARYNIDLAVVAPYVAAGINVGVPLGDAVVEGTTIDIDIANFDFNKLGLAFAAGVKVLDMIDVELRYVQGLTDIYTVDLDDTEPTFANLVRLSVGLYIF
ncbi:MAG: porin family protein [Candidatus Marinimicrobia bacterium]|nr:porin family protein [Candidatus Neomarinimicrobiota bacterium]